MCYQANKNQLTLQMKWQINQGKIFGSFDLFLVVVRHLEEMINRISKEAQPLSWSLWYSLEVEIECHLYWPLLASREYYLSRQTF